MASLLVVSGPSQGDYHPLSTEVTVIGRGQSCNIRIADTLISPRHVQIREDPAGSGHHAKDLGSATGTFINGSRIAAETLLASGNILRIGASRIVFYARNFADSEEAASHYRQHEGQTGGPATAGATGPGAVHPPDLEADDPKPGTKPQKSTSASGA
ncbi:MAG: FHA domain-containing protein [Phycisphaerales bacterium]|nr:MAG: FHA domain-containing protein [Phycisphaerales bacterium]